MPDFISQFTEKNIKSCIIMWYSHINNNNYKKSLNKSRKFQKICKQIIENKILSKETKIYLQVLLTGVFFSALEEFTILKKLTKDKNWYNNNKIVEKVWLLICNIRDKLDFSLIQEFEYILSFVMNYINEVENLINEQYGQSLYSSPEIKLDSVICNICNNNLKDCDHIEGKMYDNEICSVNWINPILKSVALVIDPADKRTRIWPWKMIKKENGEVDIKNTLIMSSSMVFDFLNK